MSLNYDLHSHSNVSDGALSPTELVRRAHRNGVDVFSLTDHDEVKGLNEAAQAARACGMRFVPGVEISVTWANKTLHVVGLNIDPDNPLLIEGLRKTREGRQQRARQIAASLAEQGIEDMYEAALAHVGNPALMSRTHFARALVERQICGSISEVFTRFLSEGKPGYVPMTWARLEEALEWILQAGGQPVIAHPGRYDYTPMQADALYDVFLQLGGTGIEVVTGSHTPEQYREYADVAQRYGFLASCGSDFHAPNESRIDLGGLPPLPARLRPIWQAWS
ncbi:MAG: PHP domain-containing protein [Pigmentiphaga sp.]|nr:PHP domain-containing protein [Pigmentiphaga sp.]